jgi:glycosyltransferase involved in cell wall biosynthesis
MFFITILKQDQSVLGYKENRRDEAIMLNIAMIGSVVSEGDMEKLTAVSVAGNKMQLGFLRGLKKHSNKIVTFSVKPYQMWRGKGKFFVKGQKSFIDDEIELNHITYINLLFIKQVTISFSIFFSLLFWCLINFKDSKKVVLVYNTLSYMASPALLISKIFRCRSVVIVADLPTKNPNKSIIQKIEDKKEIELIKEFELLLPLTEDIAKDFGSNQPYLVIEAGIDMKYIKTLNEKKSKNFNIVFSGSLNQFSGINLAIAAMNKINNNSIKLNIYGKGYLMDYVIKQSYLNTNIIYHGTVANEKMMKIQKSSDLLINPRIPDDFTTKYTFPSKIVEYMATGVPVLCNKLSGIPHEYYNYITALDSPDEELWAKTIENIKKENSGDFLEKAKEGKKFINNNKTWEHQGDKIYKFIKDNIGYN